MIGRVHPLALAVVANLLAVAAVLGTNGAALAAGECIQKPNRQIDQAGHWYYHVDRAHHRRCWYLETSGVTARPASSPDRMPSRSADPNSSWFSWLIAGLEQTVSSESYQNSIMVDSSTVTKAPSPRPPKTVKVTRSRIAPLPETNGAASAERKTQLLSQASERVEKETPELTPVDRDALFDEFLRWYAERSIFSGK